MLLKGYEFYYSFFYKQEKPGIYIAKPIFIDPSCSLPRFHFQALLYKNLTVSF